VNPTQDDNRVVVLNTVQHVVLLIVLSKSKNLISAEQVLPLRKP